MYSIVAVARINSRSQEKKLLGKAKSAAGCRHGQNCGIVGVYCAMIRKPADGLGVTARIKNIATWWQLRWWLSVGGHSGRRWTGKAHRRPDRFGIVGASRRRRKVVTRRKGRGKGRRRTKFARHRGTVVGGVGGRGDRRNLVPQTPPIFNP